MSREDALRVKLVALLEEHGRLNEQVDRLGLQAATASLELQRLKKRKLILRDEITALQDRITPDIIA